MMTARLATRPAGRFVRVGWALAAVGALAAATAPAGPCGAADRPGAEAAVLEVTAAFADAEADIIADVIARPLELALVRVAGVEEIRSSSIPGQTRITLRFARGADLDRAARDVQAALDAAVGDLPEGLAGPPVCRKIPPDTLPMLYVALTSADISLGRLGELAQQQVRARLLSIEGVAEVRVHGAPRKAIRVELDPASLAKWGVTVDQVAQAVPAGSVGQARGLPNGPTTQPGAAIAEIGETVVVVRDGNAVRLRDLARIAEIVEPDHDAAWYCRAASRQRAVVLAVQRRPDASPDQVRGRIEAMLPAIREPLPESAALSVLDPHQADRTIACLTECPAGTSFQHRARLRDALHHALLGDGDVEVIVSVVPIDEFAAGQTGLTLVRLKAERDRKRTVERVIDDLRARAGIPGLMVRMGPAAAVSTGPDGGMTLACWRYTIRGAETDELYPASERLVQVLRGIDGLADVASDLKMGPQLSLRVDRGQVLRLGLTAAQVADFLQVALGSGSVRTGDNAGPRVILGLPRPVRGDPDAVLALLITRPDGRQVPLRSFIQTFQENRPLSVNRTGLSPSVTLSGGLRPGVSETDARAMIERAVGQVLPAGVTGQFAPRAGAEPTTRPGSP